MSTDVVFDPVSEEYFTGAERTYRRLRDEAPVYRNDEQDFYALSRYDDVATAYKDWQTFTSSKGIMLDQMCIPGFDGTQMPGFLGLYDPPLHLRVRTLTSSALTPSKVGDAIADIVALVTSVGNDETEHDGRGRRAALRPAMLPRHRFVGDDGDQSRRRRGGDRARWLGAVRYIAYTADGQMHAILIDPDRPPAGHRPRNSADPSS